MLQLEAPCPRVEPLKPVKVLHCPEARADTVHAAFERLDGMVFKEALRRNDVVKLCVMGETRRMPST